MKGDGHPVQAVTKGMFSLRGTLSRRRFFVRSLGYLIFTLLLFVIGVSARHPSGMFRFPLFTLGPLICLPWVWLVAQVQRLRDAGLPLSLAVCGFIPLIALLAFEGETRGTVLFWAGSIGWFSFLTMSSQQASGAGSPLAPTPQIDPSTIGATYQGMAHDRRPARKLDPKLLMPTAGRPSGDRDHAGVGQSTIGGTDLGADEVQPANVKAEQPAGRLQAEIHHRGNSGLAGREAMSLGKPVFLVATVFGGAMIGTWVGAEIDRDSVLVGALCGAVLGGAIAILALRASDSGVR